MVVVQCDKEASQTRDFCGAKGAPLRAARPDPSLRKGGLLRMTSKLRHYLGDLSRDMRPDLVVSFLLTRNP